MFPVRLSRLIAHRLFSFLLLPVLLLAGNGAAPVMAQTSPVSTLFDQACSLQKARQYDAAIALFCKIIVMAPDNYQSFAHRGFCLSESGHPEQALPDLDAAIKMKPDFFWSYYVRGFTDRRLDLNERAIQDLSRALELKADYTDSYIERAEAYVALEQYQNALADTQRALALSAESLRALKLRAQILRKSKQYQLALECADKIISLKPDWAEAYNIRGVTYAAMDRAQRAIEDYDRAIALDPNDPVIYLNRGESLRKMNKLSQAIDDYNKSIACKRDNPSAYKALGSAYIDLGENQKAVETLNQALALAPDDPSALESRAIAFNMAKEYGKAIADATKSLALNSERAHTLVTRGNAYRGSGQFEKALADYNKAIALSPDDDSVYRGRGVLYLRKGMNQEALLDLNKSLALRPENNDYALFDLSVAYDRLGQSDRKAEFLARLQASPTYELHKRNIARLKAELDESAEHLAGTPEATSSPAGNQPVKDKWALVIGISKFQRSQYDLKYAAKDAQDFYNFLTTEAGFRKDHVKLLLNEQATRTNIMSAFGSKWLPNVTEPGDMVVVFISTHGTPSVLDNGGRNYIAAWDTDADDPYPTAVDMDDVYRRIRDGVKTDRALIVLDTCYSGNAVPGDKGLGRSGNFDVGKIQLGQGHLVISSSSDNEKSWESKRYPNGVFTRSLIQALRTNKGRVDVKSAFETLKQSVNWEVKCDYGSTQTPEIGGDWQGSALVISAPAVSPRSLGPVLQLSPAPAPVPGTLAPPKGQKAPDRGKKNAPARK